MRSMQSFISGIPKAELHVHVEGTIEPDMLLLLAKRNNASFAYKNVEDIKRGIATIVDLPTFLRFYKSVLSVLLTEQDFYDVTYTFLEKSRSQNVLYVELMFDPQAHLDRGLDLEAVINGMRHAQHDAENKLGTRSKLIMCMWRERSEQEAMKLLNQAIRFSDDIVGIGLDNIEEDNFPLKFVEVFAKARDEGFEVTSHCDSDQPKSVTHIRQCIEKLGVRRIDHGTNVLDDQALVDMVIERDICLTVCPTQTYAFDEPRRTKAVRTMLDLGINVTVNSDDPGIDCSRYMNEIIGGVYETVGLTRSDVVQLMKNAFRSAWLAGPEREYYLQLLDDHAKQVV